MSMRLCAIYATLLATGSLSIAQPQQTKLEGVWKISRAIVLSPAQPPNTAPQPSIYMFSRSHYAFVRVNGSAPRPPLPKDRMHATPDQLLAVLGQNFSAQGGTYVLAGNLLTLQAEVSKEPGAMQGWARFDVKMGPNTLTMTTREAFNGPPVVVTEFVLTRLE
jgi:hypothetical protein